MTVTSTAPAPAVSGHVAGSRQFRNATVAMFAAGMAAFMAMYHVQAMLPVFADHFGVSPTTSALSVSLTTGFLAFAIIPVSVLSERYGRIKVMVVSAVAASLHSAAHGACATPQPTLLTQFPPSVRIENLTILPNSTIIVTNAFTGELYGVNPLQQQPQLPYYFFTSFRPVSNASFAAR